MSFTANPAVRASTRRPGATSRAPMTMAAIVRSRWPGKAVVGVLRVAGKLACPGALLIALIAAQPSAAQKLYAHEPLVMDPYATIYVDDGSCSAGKILKVQNPDGRGPPRNHHRRKSCVPVTELQGGARPAQR